MVEIKQAMGGGKEVGDGSLCLSYWPIHNGNIAKGENAT